MKRTIFLIPNTEHLGLIQNIRKRYDPLADKIPPHITLVFPFLSNISNAELKKHITTAVHAIKRFKIRLKDITLHGEYIFLNVDIGREQIIHLHDTLYTGPLAENLSHTHQYRPHITLGRFSENREIDMSEFKQLGETSIEGEINTIYVEEIQDDESSKILMKIPLN